MMLHNSIVLELLFSRVYSVLESTLKTMPGIQLDPQCALVGEGL